MTGERIRSGTRRWLLRGAASLLVLLVVVGAGRLGQVALQSRYSGERGPYLQMQSPGGITIRWQTVAPVAGVVHYGEQRDRLDRSVRESSAREVHELRLNGLKPGTRYYYTVGPQRNAPAGASGDDWFFTAPPPGSARPVRIWVQGDPGYAQARAFAVRDAALKWMTDHPRPGLPYLDLWFTTGDNAYRSGTNAEFQANLFDAYPRLLRNIPYWPAYGNHDARRWAFFDIFSFPEDGESGGVPSGSEHYYSFDFANIHFVFLDSEDSDRSRDGAMLDWLRKDLAATRQRWLVAVFHHPPYSKGSHDSDSTTDSRGRMTEMRENALPILEAAGVDLVLSGHSHVYERSYLLDCHYGASASLKPAMILDKGHGRNPPYRKPKGLAPHSGAVYAVVGSSAKLGNGPLNHPANAVSLHEFGSLLLDVQGERLEARFINDAGQVLDHFAIEKSAAVAPRPVGACGAK